MLHSLPQRLSGKNFGFVPRLLLFFFILGYFVYFGLYATRRHLAFETGAFDLGVFAQPMWNLINGRGLALSLVADIGATRWAIHVEPILYLLAPFYRLWPDPRTLLWLQVAALSLAALPLYGLAWRRLQNEWVALVVVLAYFLMPAVEAVTLFDFHPVAFAPLFLLAGIYFLDLALAGRGQSFWLWPEALTLDHQAKSRLIRYYLLAAFFFVLALSTKEDISLHLFMLGLYLLLLRRQWREGGALVLVGLVWFYVAFQLVIPTFRVAGEHSIFTTWFEALGDTPLAIALSPLNTPDKVAGLLFRPGSVPAVGMLTLPLALLPLAGLPFLLMATPSLAVSLLSQPPLLRQLESWHYAAPMISFVMLAAIDGLARLSHYLPRLTPHIKQPNASRSTLYVLTGVLLLSALTYHYLRGYSHLSKLAEWPEITAHHRLGREIAAAIPADAAVLAQAQLVPHLTGRQKLTIWTGPLDTAYGFVWLDLSHPQFPNRFNAHGDLLTGLVIEPAFGPVVAQDGYLLLQKNAERVPLSEQLFTFTEFEQIPAGAQPFNALFGNALKLAAVKPQVRRLAITETEPQVILYFEVLRQPAEDYHLFLYRLDQDGSVGGATDYAQPALVWWPTSRWQPGERRQVRVNTIPWWTGDKSRFGYALGLSHSDDPWDVAARLPITLPADGLNPPGSQPLDHDTLLPIAAFQRRFGLPYPQPLTALPAVERGD